MSNTRTALTARTSSRYQEFPPPPSLSDRLVCTWTQNIRGVDGEYHPHPVLPDGCVDVVWIGGAAPVVAGPATHRIVVKLPAGTILIGIRFRPGCAASSLGLPVNEVLNQDAPLADIRPHHAKCLTDETFDQQSESTRLRNITTALANRLAVAPDPDPAVQVAIPCSYGTRRDECAISLVRSVSATGSCSDVLSRRSNINPRPFNALCGFNDY